MWGNYALSLYRNLSRRWLYTGINVLGLALGIAVFGVLALVVRFETSFDRWIPGAQDIYRVNAIHHWPGQARREQPDTQGPLLPNLLAEFPQIKAGARLFQTPAIVQRQGRPVLEQVVLADPTMFQVFDLPLAAGARSAALGDTTSLIVSQATARKYFGTERAMGRELTLVIGGVARNYRVTGVLKDLPPNTHLKLGLIVRLAPEAAPHAKQLSQWSSSMLFTYIRLGSPADAAALQAAMPGFVNRRVTGEVPTPAGQYLGFRLRPLTTLNFADAHTSDAFRTGADPLFVGALGAMGVAALLIAVVNYISLATAHAGLRAREVAMRKVVGATRKALVVQFVAEALAVALAAGLVAGALIELSMPAVSAILGETIRVRYFGPEGVAPPLLGLSLVVGLASGIYPALVLANYRPAAVLASARTPGGGRRGARVREVLALGQFAAAICLMICTAVIFAQIRFVHRADIGFRRDGLIIVQMGDQQVAKDKRALLQAFRGLPGVVSATASSRWPATDHSASTNVKLVSNPREEPTLMLEWIGPDYARTYGLTLLAGRPLGLEQRMDDKAAVPNGQLAFQGLNVMINKGAASTFGFSNPAQAIGQRIHVGVDDVGRGIVGTIVGVVADVRFTSPHAPATPQFYIEDTKLGPTDSEGPWSAAIRVPDADQPAVMRRIAEVWRSMEPGTPLQAQTAPAALQPYYDPDARRGQLFAVGAGLSCVIACLGLFGLAAFNTSRRYKEIGIRKTLGASTADVARLLIGEFLRPVLWANLVAWPLAFFAMRTWLAGFDQRIDLTPAAFLIASALAIAVAVATVASQTLRVARAEPAAALRYE